MHLMLELHIRRGLTVVVYVDSWTAQHGKGT